MEKIGIGIVTYERVDYFKRCIERLKELQLDDRFYIIIVDDCSTKQRIEYNNVLIEQPFMFIINPENCGVAHSKNTALSYLIKKKCDYIFLIEDDILVDDIQVFDEYINYHKKSGIHHFNFAHHGTMNQVKIDNLTKDGELIGELYPNCVGAFSFYTRECLLSVGLMDDNFKNAWEHVEHTNRIAKKNFTTPFWYFVDIPNSSSFLSEIEGSITNSSIRPRKDWQDNITKGLQYWKQKDGVGLPPRPYN